MNGLSLGPVAGRQQTTQSLLHTSPFDDITTNLIQQREYKRLSECICLMNAIVVGLETYSFLREVSRLRLNEQDLIGTLAGFCDQFDSMVSMLQNMEHALSSNMKALQESQISRICTTLESYRALLQSKYMVAKILESMVIHAREARTVMEKITSEATDPMTQYRKATVCEELRFGSRVKRLQKLQRDEPWINAVRDCHQKIMKMKSDSNPRLVV